MSTAKTNNGLVAYAKKALAERWGYVWGTFGKLLTEKILDDKIRQYPDGVGKYQMFIRQHWLGRKTSDCVGLIKSYLWFDGNDVHYDGHTDVSANGMHDKAKEKGPISTIPDIPGVCVWKEGHIGVYIGNGLVIEAHNTSHGVIQTPLKGRGATPWTDWLKCPYIAYEANYDYHKESAKPTHEADIKALCTALKVKDITQLPILKPGSTGAAVKYVQKRLGATVDGVYGPLTASVVRAFQTRSSFDAADVDGIVGPKTWKQLAK